MIDACEFNRKLCRWLSKHELDYDEIPAVVACLMKAAVRLTAMRCQLGLPTEAHSRVVNQMVETMTKALDAESHSWKRRN